MHVLKLKVHFHSYIVVYELSVIKIKMKKITTNLSLNMT